MKKLLALAAWAFLSVLLVAMVNAGPNSDPGTQQKKEGQAQQTGQGGEGGQITPKKTGTSVVERYEKRRAIQKRAAEMRKKKMEQSMSSGTQDKAAGVKNDQQTVK